MKESGYYPPGAEFDPNAPWNQREPKAKEFDVDVMVTIRKDDVVATTSYIEEEPEYPDYIGGVVITSDVDWKEDYYENNYDVPTLLNEMADLLEKWIPKDAAGYEKFEAKELIRQARGWEVVETEIEPL